MQQPKNFALPSMKGRPLAPRPRQVKNVMSVRLMRAIGLDTYIDGLTRFGFARDRISASGSLALRRRRNSPARKWCAATLC